MGMVCIHKVVRILLKCMSPKQRPSMLCRTDIGIEGGLCMAVRASSNVQSAILNGRPKLVLWMHVKWPKGWMQTRMDARHPSHTLTLYVWTRVYDVFCVQVFCELELFTLQKLDEEWRGRSNPGPDLWCMHKRCLGGNVADWITHPEKVGTQEEAVWHHHWANGKRVSSGKTHERA